MNVQLIIYVLFNCYFQICKHLNINYGNSNFNIRLLDYSACGLTCKRWDVTHRSYGVHLSINQQSPVDNY